MKLPKMTPIKTIVHREIEGELKSVTISQTPSGKYYASLVTELDISRSSLIGEKIGLDRGVKKIAITQKYRYHNIKVYPI